MSVLIKGMDMPKDKAVILRIGEKGEVYVYGSYPTELHKAVPVPPHGRLIDADALIETNAELADCDFIHPRIGSTLREVVEDTPTIIEAEEGE